uniref:Uncharacterized protein n=1 Tax=Cucumis melo TaxID=3656 RepID=A0A9I9DP45_CUCME
MAKIFWRKTTEADNSIGRRGGMKDSTADVCEQLDCSSDSAAGNQMRAVDGGGRKRQRSVGSFE